MTLKEFVLLVLLVSWLSNVSFDSEYRLVEIFAGVARVAKCGFVKGLKVAALDISFSKDNPRAMDVNSSGGFVFLYPKYSNISVCLLYIYMNNSGCLSVVYCKISS